MCTPVPVHVGGTKRKAVVQKSGVNNGATLRSLQQVAQVTQMPVATSDAVPGTVFIQDKHLSRAEPSLRGTNGGQYLATQPPRPRKSIRRGAHQAAEGVVEPVVQGEPLHHLKKRGVVKATGVSRDKLIHAMFLSSVSIYPANSTGRSTRLRGEDVSEAHAKSWSEHRNIREYRNFSCW